jgi:hypothetical protein
MLKYCIFNEGIKRGLSIFAAFLYSSSLMVYCIGLLPSVIYFIGMPVNYNYIDLYVVLLYIFILCAFIFSIIFYQICIK